MTTPSEVAVVFTQAPTVKLPVPLRIDEAVTLEFVPLNCRASP